MDKFLIKQPGPSCSSTGLGKPKNKRPKQVTIQSLGRVVVVDDLKKCKDVLVDKNSTSENKVDALKQLGAKIPSRELMLETKIGVVVKKLTKHEETKIAAEAKKVYHKWKGFFSEREKLKPLEVKYDAKTESLRAKGRKHLANALGKEQNNDIVLGIEKEAFDICKKVSMHIYNRALRTIVLKARTDEKMRKDILDGTVPIKALVKKYTKRGEI